MVTFKGTRNLTNQEIDVPRDLILTREILAKQIREFIYIKLLKNQFIIYLNKL